MNLMQPEDRPRRSPSIWWVLLAVLGGALLVLLIGVESVAVYAVATAIVGGTSWLYFRFLQRRQERFKAHPATAELDAEEEVEPDAGDRPASEFFGLFGVLSVVVLLLGVVAILTGDADVDEVLIGVGSIAALGVVIWLVFTILDRLRKR